MSQETYEINAATGDIIRHLILLQDVVDTEQAKDLTACVNKIYEFQVLALVLQKSLKK